MVFVFAFVLSLVFVALDLCFLKVFQLSGYKVWGYLKSVAKFNFSLGSKTPLKFTNRAKRQIFVDFLVKFAIFFVIFWFWGDYFWVWLIVLATLLFSPIFVTASFLSAMPIEKFIKNRFISKAKKKLKASKCKIIAITGSFGKTSTKKFLTHFLSGFAVCASPESYNTEMGVCKTILENLKPTDEFLILEFGARRRGDIERLCKIVGGVDFCMITPLGDCHMQTFKTAENLENTKFELCQHTRGFGVFNGKSEDSKRLFDRFSGEKFLCASSDGVCRAENVQISKSGSKFDLVIDNKRLPCSCQLLGKANIDNLVLAAQMALLLGVDAQEIVTKISNLSPTKHRLELISGNNVTVIDDSYNSNFAGFCEALDVLACFEGRKIVVSPGFVELGRLQFEENRKIAEKVAEVADVFVIMNKTNRAALEQGAAGKCKIFHANTRSSQRQILREILRPCDVVLFENDLPDNMK